LENVFSSPAQVNLKVLNKSGNRGTMPPPFSYCGPGTRVADALWSVHIL